MQKLTSSISAIIQASAASSDPEGFLSHLRMGTMDDRLVYEDSEDEWGVWSYVIRAFSGSADAKRVRFQTMKIAEQAHSILLSETPIVAREDADSWRWFGRWLAIQFDAGTMTMKRLHQFMERSSESSSFTQMQLVMRLSTMAQQYLVALVKCAMGSTPIEPWARITKIATQQPCTAYDIHIVREFFRHLHATRSDVHNIDLLCALWPMLKHESPQRTIRHFSCLTTWIRNFEEHRWLVEAWKSEDIATQWICSPAMHDIHGQVIVQHREGPVALVEDLSFKTEEGSFSRPIIQDMGPFLNWVSLRAIQYPLDSWRRKWLLETLKTDAKATEFGSTIGGMLKSSKMPDLNALQHAMSLNLIGFHENSLISLCSLPWTDLNIIAFQEFFWSFCQASGHHYDYLISSSGLESHSSYKTHLNHLEEMIENNGCIADEWLGTPPSREAYLHFERAQAVVREYLKRAPSEVGLTMDLVKKYGVEAVRQSTAAQHPWFATVDEWLVYANAAKIMAQLVVLQADTAQMPASLMASPKGKKTGDPTAPGTPPTPTTPSAHVKMLHKLLQHPETLEKILSELDEVEA